MTVHFNFPRFWSSSFFSAFFHGLLWLGWCRLISPCTLSQFPCRFSPVFQFGTSRLSSSPPPPPPSSPLSSLLPHSIRPRDLCCFCLDHPDLLVRVFVPQVESILEVSTIFFPTPLSSIFHAHLGLSTPYVYLFLNRVSTFSPSSDEVVSLSAGSPHAFVAFGVPSFVLSIRLFLRSARLLPGWFLPVLCVRLNYT